MAKTVLHEKDASNDIRFFRGTKSPASNMPVVIFNADSSIELISQLGHVAKSAGHYKFQEQEFNMKKEKMKTDLNNG